MPSLLLVEFAVIERLHRAVEFPYILGQARARGVPARWVRFGVPVDGAFAAGGAGVPVSDEDAATVLAHVREVQADHVIFSHAPSDALAEPLLRTRPGLRCWHLGSPVSEHGGATTRLPEGGLDALPDVPRVDASARRAAGDLPDFGFLPGNAAAREIEVLPYLFLGHECTWNRPLEGNPFFEGLDLTTCIRATGCAFCARPADPEDTGEPPPERLRRQLGALAATCPTFGRRLQVRLVGEPVVNNIGAVVDGILDAGVAPADFLLDSRADTLVRREEALRSALAALAGTGHRLHLCLIGIESFSSAELERFNKGTDPASNLAAVRTLLSLEADHPETFSFRQHGGLSLITFTPWTAPEELDLNLAVLDLLDLAEVAGKHLTGRLRLHPGLPLEVRARADGLMRGRYDDRLLDTARQTFYGEELPWAFRDPRMEPINRVLLRLGTDGESGDPMAAQVDALHETARKAGMSRTRLAHVLIRVAMRLAWTDGALTAEALIRAARDELEVPVEAEPPPAFEVWTTVAPPERSNPKPAMVPLGRALSVKPVTRVEPLRREDAALWLASPDIPNAQLRRRPEGGGGAVYEVFFGAARADVDRALAVATVLDGKLTAKDGAAAYQEMGELLGYPTCCAAAYAAAPAGLRNNYFWLHVANRVGIPGEIPWELAPIPGILVEYVPCALDCAASGERARGNLEAIPWRTPALRATFEASLKHPRMLFHGNQSSALELIPEEEPGERFRYRAGQHDGRDADLTALALGDELILGPETLLVLRQGRPWASLSGRAFLWWHERPFQAALWQAMLGVRGISAGVPQAPPSREDAPPPLPQEMALLGRLLQLFRQHSVDLEGLRVESWEHSADGRRITLVLGGAGAEVQLVIEERGVGSPALWEEGPYALSHPKDRPLESEQQWAAAKAFRATLRKALRKIDHPRR